MDKRIVDDREIVAEAMEMVRRFQLNPRYFRVGRANFRPLLEGLRLIEYHPSEVWVAYEKQKVDLLVELASEIAAIKNAEARFDAWSKINICVVNKWSGWSGYYSRWHWSFKIVPLKGEFSQTIIQPNVVPTPRADRYEVVSQTSRGIILCVYQKSSKASKKFARDKALTYVIDPQAYAGPWMPR